MVMSNVVKNFAADTTIHGVPRIINAKSTLAKIVWTAVCISAATMACFQATQLLQKYYSYNKKVTVEIIPAEMQFPAISLCNMRNLDIMVLNALNRIFKNDTDPLTWGNLTDDAFINSYMLIVAKYYPMFLRTDIDINVFRTVLTRALIASNMDRELVTGAGVPFKEFIVTCRFGGADCNRSSEWSQFFDPYYYNCFTYIASEPDGDKSLAEGLENGWSTTVLTGGGMLDQNEVLRTIPGTHDRFSPESSNEGVRVVVHPPDAQPYPHTEGFDVPPGHSVSFGVKIRLTERIGPPHGNCSHLDPYGQDRLGAYRLMSCQKKCLQAEIVKVCGCKEISLPDQNVYPDVKYCTLDNDIPLDCRTGATDHCVDMLHKVYKRFECVRNNKARLARSAKFAQSCGCYPPCRDVSYHISYSLANWPAESFDGEEAYIDIFESEGYSSRFTGLEDEDKYKLYAKYFDISNRKQAMKDFSRLNVYIANSNVLKTEESEDYTSNQLISDIGGQLGLWVGISIISLAEALQFLIDMIRYAHFQKVTAIQLEPHFDV